GRRHLVRRDRPNPGSDVHRLPAEGAAARRRLRLAADCDPARRAWPVGAWHGGVPRRLVGLAQLLGLTAPTRYSITRSARSSNDCGIVIPIDCAAFRLTTNSNVVGSSTGSVAGSAPLAILSM